MVNSKDFSKRLEKIINYYELSAASFADKIDVGRSSISHILSERNKPSLDFVMKIVTTFPEVELYWLLNGKGSFPKNTSSQSESTPSTTENFSEQQQLSLSDSEKEQPVVSGLSSKNKAIQKIVIFYKDGTFDAYEN